MALHITAYQRDTLEKLADGAHIELREGMYKLHKRYARDVPETLPENTLRVLLRKRFVQEREPVYQRIGTHKRRRRAWYLTDKGREALEKTMVKAGARYATLREQTHGG